MPLTIADIITQWTNQDDDASQRIGQCLRILSMLAPTPEEKEFDILSTSRGCRKELVQSLKKAGETRVLDELEQTLLDILVYQLGEKGKEIF